MKKSVLSILAAAAVISLVSTSAFALPDASGNDEFRGDVPAINSISVAHTTKGVNDRIESLGQAALSNEEVFQYTISNNDPAGFTLTVESANAGKMIRDGGGNVNAGDFLDYTITTQAGDNASTAKFLGATEPTQMSATSLATPQNMNYNSGLQKATVDYTYVLGITADEKPELFRGLFRDTITVTISDNS